MTYIKTNSWIQTNASYLGLAASIIMGGGAILQVLFGVFLGAKAQNVEHIQYAFVFMLIAFIISFVLSIFVREKHTNLTR